MITEFTERRPALSAVIIVLLFTLVPGAFMLVADTVSGGAWNSTTAVFVYVLVLQLILWLTVERPILIMLPFVMALLGLIVSEIVYTVSMSMAPIGQGPSALALLFSSAAVTLFGVVAPGSIGGLLAYAVVVVVRKLRELIAR